MHTTAPCSMAHLANSTCRTRRLLFSSPLFPPHHCFITLDLLSDSNTLRTRLEDYPATRSSSPSLSQLSRFVTISSSPARSPFTAAAWGGVGIGLGRLLPSFCSYSTPNHRRSAFLASLSLGLLDQKKRRSAEASLSKQIARDENGRCSSSYPSPLAPYQVRPLPLFLSFLPL